MVRVGDEIPPWTIDNVDPARMKTMAAILRDPYPVHWDRAGNTRPGMEGRVINQGPLNLSYIVNMLLAWAGPQCVRRLTVQFGRPVLDGDCVTARARVTALHELDGELLATCDVSLERSDEVVVSGVAIVVYPH
jgi:acyl dehydratase